MCGRWPCSGSLSSQAEHDFSLLLMVQIATVKSIQVG
jgi:hypothetical protein